MDWSCTDCGEDTKTEYYMVHDNLWELYAKDAFLLCVGCLEGRMGRALWSGDFTHWPVNNVNEWNKSDRLVDRLTSVNPYHRSL